MHSNFIHTRNALRSWIRYGNFTFSRNSIQTPPRWMHRKTSIFTIDMSEWSPYILVQLIQVSWKNEDTVPCVIHTIASRHYSIIRICRQRVLNAQWNYAFFVWRSNAKTSKAINLLVNSVHLCVSISAVHRFMNTLEIVIDSKSICLLGYFNNLLTLVCYVLCGNGSLMSTCSYGWHSRNVLQSTRVTSLLCGL